MRRRFAHVWLLIALAWAPTAAGQVRLVPVVTSGVQSPTFLTHAGDGSGRCRATPQESAEESGRQLCNGCKREETDRSQLRFARRTVVHVRKKEDRKDRQSPHGQKQRTDIFTAPDQCRAPLQHERHDQIIGNHDGESDRFNDHHGGRGRQAAYKRRDGEEIGAAFERQSQHKHVAVEFSGRESQQACKRDWHHKQVDQDEIKRIQPDSALDLFFVVVFDHGDMELPGQQDKRHERQQRHRNQCIETRLPAKNSGRRRALHRFADERERTIEHPERHKDADCKERHELHDRLCGDREHQAILVFGRIDVAGAEQNGECGHRQRDKERDIAEQGTAGGIAGSDMGKDRFERG